MNIRFAIPTYKRPKMILDLTMAYLKRCSIPASCIDVFVSSYYELDAYTSTLCADIDCNNIIVCNVDNVRDKFNYIHSYYPEGTNVVVIEDDIECIKRLAGYNKLSEVNEGLIGFCEVGFDACVKFNTKLWGISSNNNPFFLKDTQAGPCFKLIVANMYGFISEQPPILITQHSKTDYERTILYTRKYGSVIRLDYLCPITKNYKNAGGMQELTDNERAKMEADAVEYLAKTHPDFCRANTAKKSKFAELTLTTKRIKPNINNCGGLFEL